MELPTALSKWKLDNILPIKGFKNIGDESASVLLILGTYELITIKIQDLDASLNKKLVDKYIKRTETSELESFKDIIKEKRNTLGLLENGQLVSFKSFKKFDLEERLEDLKYFTLLDNNEFASIRVSNRNQVYLEIYKDFPNDILVKSSFNLNWPENEGLETSRLNENYCIKLIIMQNQKQFQFFKSLLIELKDDLAEILLLSIDNKLYWLTPETFDAEFSIETVKVCSSTIVEFHFLPDLSILLVLESNNCLSVIYSCSHTNLVKQKIIFLDRNVISYEFIVSQQLFVYSNGFKIFQIQIIFGECSNQILEVVREVKLRGILALTYIQYLNFIIGISENSIFYKIPIVSHQTPVAVSEEFQEVTNNHFESIDDIAKRVFYENQMQNDAEKKLANTMKDFQTLTSLLKKDLEIDVKATVIYHKNMPELNEFAVIAKKCSCWSNSTVFVEILLDVNEDLENILKNWKVNVKSGTFVSRTSVKRSNQLQFILIEELNDEIPILPNIDICLNAVLSMRNSYVLVNQKVEICLENLDQLVNCSESIQRKFSSIDNQLERVIHNLSGLQHLPKKILVESTIKVPKSSLKHLLDKFGFSDTFFINFCKSAVEVKIAGEAIHVQCDNAAALYCVKEYLISQMEPLCIKDLSQNYKEELKAIESSRNCEMNRKYLNLRKLEIVYKRSVNLSI